MGGGQGHLRSRLPLYPPGDGLCILGISWGHASLGRLAGFPGQVRLTPLPARSTVPGPVPGRANCGSKLPFGLLNLSHAAEAAAEMESGVQDICWGSHLWQESRTGGTGPVKPRTVCWGAPEKALTFRAAPCWARMAKPLYFCLTWSPGTGCLGKA